MSFKSSNKVLSFSGLELSRKKARNNTLNHLKFLGQSIEWSRIETMLVENYPTGKNKKGAQAYPPLMLFKTLEILFRKKQGFYPPPKGVAFKGFSFCRIKC